MVLLALVPGRERLPGAWQQQHTAEQGATAATSACSRYLFQIVTAAAATTARPSQLPPQPQVPKVGCPCRGASKDLGAAAGRPSSFRRVALRADRQVMGAAAERQGH